MKPRPLHTGIVLKAWLLVCCLLLPSGGVARAGADKGFSSLHDFRNITWGMSKSEVMAREKKNPVLIEERQGNKIVHYVSSLYGLKAELSYTFTRDKCWYAVYRIRSGGNAVLDDMKKVYKKLELDLYRLYGGPHAVLDTEYESIYGSTWKTGTADISLFLNPTAEVRDRLELVLSFLCRDLMQEMLDSKPKGISDF